MSQPHYILYSQNMRKTQQSLSQELITLRRAKVLEYLSTGHTSHREIARELNVAHDTIDRDVRYLMKDCNNEIRNHFKSLPLEIMKCMIGLELTIKSLTDIINADSTEPAHRLGALTARMTAYKFKMDVLDGKAQLEEVFAYMDGQQEKLNNQASGRGLTDQKGKVTIDDVSEHT